LLYNPLAPQQMIKTIISFVFAPNIYSFLGLTLLLIGFILAPLLIGFLIMPVGAILLVFGVHLSVIRLIPGHKQIIKTVIDSYRPLLNKWKK